MNVHKAILLCFYIFANDTDDEEPISNEVGDHHIGVGVRV